MVLILHLSPIRKIRAINLTNQKAERQQSSSSEKKNSKYDLSTKNVSEQTLLISNPNLRIPRRNRMKILTVQNKQEIFLLASNVAMLAASKEVHTSLTDIKIVVLKGVPNHHPSIPTWEKLHPRARIINPNAIHHRKRDLLEPPLRTMIADDTFLMIQIIYQMPVHKRTRISNMLKAS